MSDGRDTFWDGDHYSCNIGDYKGTGALTFNYTQYQECKPHDVPHDCLCDYVGLVQDCLTTSRIPYLESPYCVFDPYAFIGDLLMLLWLVFLFVNLALVVDARVVPNVTAIAKMLKMSDNLAGLTLLAFGNGVVDIFSAGAAVLAAEKGGTMGISVLLGCGLYVTTFVSAVIAYNFEPEVQFRSLGRDCIFYFIGLVWTAWILEDHKLYLWEIIGFPIMYFFYLAYAIISETMQEANPNSKLGRFADKFKSIFTRSSLAEISQEPLIPTATGDVYHDLYDDMEFADGVHPGIVQALSRYSHLKHDHELPAHSLHSPGSLRYTISRMDLFDTHEGSKWEKKSLVAKMIVILQLPLKTILSLSTPVVFYEDFAIAWDKRLHVIISFSAPPIAVILTSEDAFYWMTSSVNTIPALFVSLVLGFILSMTVWRTTKIEEPPRWNGAFAVLGFCISLFYIYAISEEMVSLIRSFGLIWGIPTSIIAMAILGAGNGTCDLVSNYIIASRGRPNIAIGAAYGAPVLNLYMGMTAMGIIGGWRWGLPFPMYADKQIFSGLAVIMVGLIPAMVSSYQGKIGTNTAKFLFSLYAIFIIVSLIGLFFV